MIEILDSSSVLFLGFNPRLVSLEKLFNFFESQFLDSISLLSKDNSYTHVIIFLVRNTWYSKYKILFDFWLIVNA